MKTFTKTMIAGLVAAALSSCGGGDSSSSGGTSTPLTISVSDAPSDEMLEVVVVFSKIALLPVDDDDDDNDDDESSDPIEINFDPVSVNLLDYQGGDARALIEGREIPDGYYKMCVFAHDGDHPSTPSYVVHEDDGMLPLTVKGNGTCPQGVGSVDDTGVLYFNETFTIDADNSVFVVEFDLRRGIKEDGVNEYSIQRTSVDMMNEVETGELEGEVDDNTYGYCETGSTNGYQHAVYLYSGNVPIGDMGPFAGAVGKVTPITSANVLPEDDEDEPYDDEYEYEFGYLEPGTYSVGYTCTANDDSEDGLLGDENFSIYKAESGVVVVAGEETEVDL